MRPFLLYNFNVNLPNKLTLLRIILIPIICLVWLFPYSTFNITFGVIDIGQISVSILNLIILVLFVIASLTDLFDGRIARKKGLVTTFGKFADPIADKLLINSILIIMASKQMIPPLPVVLMLARDIVVDGCRMLAGKNGVVIAAGFLGKLKTVLQMITIILILINNLPFELIGLPVSEICLWFTTFVSLIGGYSYFSQSKKLIFESM